MNVIEKIELQNITKRFPGVLANDGITLTFNRCEVHTLLGENGAGKSTLMKILYGLYKPDEGRILFNGREMAVKSPQDTADFGLGMVHQHFMLVPSFTVTENIVLNYPSPKWPFVDLESARKKIKHMSEEYGLFVNPDVPVWQLSVGEQQRVEILKVIFREASFIILDEPTAVLTPQEVEDFFKILRRMVGSGHGIIFISHKLNEVLKISDKITVLRNGRIVGRVQPIETTGSELANMMVGREVLTSFKKEEKPQERKPILRFQNVEVLNDKKLTALADFSFDLMEGEVLGIAGVSGNGQKELAEAIAGLRKVEKGKIFIGEKDITNQKADEIIKSKVAYIPEERMRMGVIKDFTVMENLILKSHSRSPQANWIFLNLKHIRESSQGIIEEFDVRTPSIDTPVRNLSGGNIQKLILARELSTRPDILIAAQPTRGVDVGASEYIHRRIVEMRNQGVTVLLISEDLDEIMELSDRIMVIYEGKNVGIVPPSTPVEQIGLMMTGGFGQEATAGINSSYGSLKE
ncbi:MAG: ABC transporter ATP-binding protein [Spirochaetota bacterium]